MSSSEEQKLFKLILAAVASEDLSAADYQIFLTSLRDGDMVRVLDQIVSLLARKTDDAKPTVEKSAKRLEKVDRVDQKSISADELFDDVKRRKITRERLESIVMSIDSSYYNSTNRPDTMRGLIASFKEYATERQWKILTSIVNGNYEADPYFDRAS